MTKTSVIIPVYNAAATLELCLKALQSAKPENCKIIVVDDCSIDESYSIASAFADQVHRFEVHRGRAAARNTGVGLTDGEIIVFVDSDVVVARDSLNKILAYFETYPKVDAVTGLLAKEHPNHDFFSQYKNLYMHYTFMKSPEDITFLYGSIHALRRTVIKKYDSAIRLTDDTAQGQDLFKEGKVIKLMKDLQVIHYKKHNFFSLVKNDFQIPYDWGILFMKNQGWRQLGKKGTGFAHAPKEQLLAIICTGLMAVFAVLLFAGLKTAPILLTLFTLWCLFTFKFHRFLAQERGTLFLLKSVIWTFGDHIIMGAGIFCGLIKGLFEKS